MGICSVKLLKVVIGGFLWVFMFCDGAILVVVSWDEWLRLEEERVVLLVVC
jgi:hypothetical protein